MYHKKYMEQEPETKIWSSALSPDHLVQGNVHHHCGFHSFCLLEKWQYYFSYPLQKVVVMIRQNSVMENTRAWWCFYIFLSQVQSRTHLAKHYMALPNHHVSLSSTITCLMRTSLITLTSLQFPYSTGLFYFLHSITLLLQSLVISTVFSIKQNGYFMRAGTDSVLPTTAFQFQNTEDNYELLAEWMNKGLTLQKSFEIIQSTCFVLQIQPLSFRKFK